MTNWVQKINITPILESWNDDEDDVNRVATEVAAELESRSTAFHRALPKVREAKTVYTFDLALQEVYDIADRCKIWLGRS